MAQQLGAVRFKGKLANVVGYKNSASRKQNNNFARERVYEVSNPKTEAQAIQRAKVRPAQIFYNGFERILNHAFLPSQRASRNRNRFISHAMKLKEIPDIEKGQAFLPFCNYKISEGALGLDDLARAENFKRNPGIENLDWSGCVHFPNLKGGDDIEFDSGDTIAAVSEVLISNNAGLIEGMELTFLAVVASTAEPTQRIAQVFSFVLNQGDTITTLGDIMGTFLIFKQAADYSLILATETDDYEVLSAGLIISAKAGNTYIYTNSSMQKSWRAEEVYSEDEADVIASYMADSSSSDSDLILQQANNAMAGNVVRPASIASVDFEVVEGAGTASGSHAAVVITNLGTQKVLVLNASGALASYEDGVLTPLTIENGGSASPLTIDLTNLKGNGTITLADVIAVGLNVQVISTEIAQVDLVEVGNQSNVAKGTYLDYNTAEDDYVGVEGTGLNSNNVQLKNATTGDYIQPSLVESESIRFTMTSSSGVYQVIINGDVWCTFYNTGA